jgi:YVTN family beta-propeller protein
MRFMRSRVLVVLVFVVAVDLTSSCGESPADKPLPVTSSPPTTTAATPLAPDDPLPGMPPVLVPSDVYAATRPEHVSPVVQGFSSRVYVPNGLSNTVDVIDPETYQIVESFAAGREPQHVVPSYDLKTLWVLNNQGNTLTRIDPATGKQGDTVRVDDPYNLYYTPDGKYALVVAERLRRLDFRDPETMRLHYALPVPCRGVNHLDYAANGRYLLASCEFSSEVIKVDIVAKKVLGTLRLPGRGQPQDVRLSPDGKVFYIADMRAHGVYVVDGEHLTVLDFLPTGKGAHGLNVSRDAKVLYVSNRNEGSISVIDFATRKVVNTWRFPGGGSPDMGSVSTDGKVLWLAGRYHHEVYAIDTTNGHLLARVKVGKGPHGLCLYPQPGRYFWGIPATFAERHVLPSPTTKKMDCYEACAPPSTLPDRRILTP